jgi:hypothetical protein
MERYCGLLAKSAKSQQSPYISISRRICDITQLSQIKAIYDLEELLNVKGQSRTTGKFYNECERLQIT